MTGRPDGGWQWWTGGGCCKGPGCCRVYREAGGWGTREAGGWGRDLDELRVLSWHKDDWLWYRFLRAPPIELHWLRLLVGWSPFKIIRPRINYCACSNFDFIYLTCFTPTGSVAVKTTRGEAETSSGESLLLFDYKCYDSTVVYWTRAVTFFT